MVEGRQPLSTTSSRDTRYEIDLIGADRRDLPEKRVTFIGSIKWRERQKMGKTDHADLLKGAVRVPGVGLATTRTIAVSRLGTSADASHLVDLVLDADDILGAWSVS